MIQIDERPVHRVVGNTDRGGAGASVVLGYFLDRGAAESFAVGKGVWGTNAEVVTETLKVVSAFNPQDKRSASHFYLLGAPIYAGEAPEGDRRAAALAKLTPEERKLLGL